MLMLPPSHLRPWPSPSPSLAPLHHPPEPCRLWSAALVTPLLSCPPAACYCHSYSSKLEAAVRGRRGRHFPHMRVIPPGLDFSGLKVAGPIGAGKQQQQQQQQHTGIGQLSIPPSPKGGGSGGACTTPTSGRALQHCPSAPAHADIAGRGTWQLHCIILHVRCSATESAVPC